MQQISLPFIKKLKFYNGSFQKVPIADAHGKFVQSMVERRNILRCPKGGEACRYKFEKGFTWCKKLLLLDVWIDLGSKMFVNLNQKI